MGISFSDGIKGMVGAVGDVVTAPLDLAPGGVRGVVDAAKAPMNAKKGLIETIAGAVVNPLQGAGRVVGVADQPPEVVDGAQRAFEDYL